MKIGIISENYFYDSEAYKILLNKHVYRKGQKEICASFIPIGKNIEGDKLLTSKAVKTINAECEKKDIHFVILAKDLDALPSDEKKINILSKKIKDLSKQITPRVLPFIIIFEQEALILANIEAFNSIYKTNSSFNKNPKFQSNPKDFLKRLTSKSNRKYKESDTPEIFQQLDFQTVYKNHKGENSFQSFIKTLEKEIT